MALDSASRTDIDVRRLLSFAAVAELGTGTAAAQCLGCSPSRVSALLRAVEQEFKNSSLFCNSARGLGLTDAGRAEDSFWAHSEAESRGVMSSADAKDGPLAFAEKRDPVWQGC